jgi:hypothetical protein
LPDLSSARRGLAIFIRYASAQWNAAAPTRLWLWLSPHKKRREGVMEPSWSIPIPQAMQQHGGLTSNKRTTRPAAAAPPQPVTVPSSEPASVREPDAQP